MRIRAVVISLALLVSAHKVQAYTTVFVNDPEGFFAAAGDVRTIDFETLPNGSPSRGDVEITPEFNYADQGVLFTAPFPRLRITHGSGGGFALTAFATPSSDPNWIIATFVTPVTAVGMFFPGRRTLMVLNGDGSVIAEGEAGGGLPTFLGIVSDDPISVAIQNEGGPSGFIDSLFFVPVPEPASLLLLALGGGVVVSRRRELDSRS